MAKRHQRSGAYIPNDGPMDANCECGHGLKCHVDGHCHLCEGNAPQFMQPDHAFVPIETEHTRPCHIHYPDVNGRCAICGRPAH